MKVQKKCRAIAFAAISSLFLFIACQNTLTDSDEEQNKESLGRCIYGCPSEEAEYSDIADTCGDFGV